MRPTVYTRGGEVYEVVVGRKQPRAVGTKTAKTAKDGIRVVSVVRAGGRYVRGQERVVTPKAVRAWRQVDDPRVWDAALSVLLDAPPPKRQRPTSRPPGFRRATNSRPAYLNHTPGSPWTYPQLRSIAAAMKAGDPLERIAREIGVSRQAISAASKRAGIPLIAYTLGEAVLAELNDDPRTVSDIAKRLGHSRSKIGRMLSHQRRLGRVTRAGSPQEPWSLTESGREWVRKRADSRRRGA